jgi:hypothetical protein
VSSAACEAFMAAAAPTTTAKANVRRNNIALPPPGY